jgi:hypothetical protein
MMTRSRLLSVLGLSALLSGTSLFSLPVRGNVVAESASVFSGGADLRLRDEYFNGASTLSTDAPRHEQNYLRFRARAWGVWTLPGGASLHTRLVTEPRYWTTESATKTFLGKRGLEERFAMLDALNVQHKTRIGGLPVAFTVGRQDLKLGEAASGWLVSEGTPCDGSWTAYFDAARATVDASALRTTFDVVVIDQLSDPDDRLPTLGRSDAYPVAEQDERGVIVYAANRAIERVQLDGFFIYKENRRVLANGNDARLSTAGFRVAGALSPAWQYSVEGAFQSGSKQDVTLKIPAGISGRRDVQAWAGNGRFTWLAKDEYDQRLSLIAEYLSGDDPGTTGRDEMFDMLWGRCPRFSDIVATAFSVENGCTYQAANLVRLGPEWSCVPTKATSFTLGWQALLAPETVPTRASKPAAFSGSGRRRGDFFRAIWRQRLSKRVTTLLALEALKQGDFYSRRDTLTFLRAEIAVTF